MKKIYLFLILLFSIGKLFAQPANNNCSGAIPLTVTIGNCTPSMPISWMGATASTVPTPACGTFSTAFNDVWFSAVVPASGNLFINTSAGTTITDGVMAVYTGTCGSLTEIGCSDDVSSPTYSSMPNIILTGLTVGSTIYIRFWDYNGLSTGDIGGICVSDPPVPPNDNCSGAIPLTVSSGNCTPTTPISWTNATASSLSNPSCLNSFYINSNIKDLWYKAVVPASGNLFITTTAGTATTDGVMAAYSGTCGSLTEIGCNDDANGGSMPELFLTGLTVGSTIYIRFWDYGGAISGDIGGICASEPLPDYTLCNAPNITYNQGYSGTNTTSLAATGVLANALTNAGVTWPFYNTSYYKFTAQSNNTISPLTILCSTCGFGAIDADLLTMTGPCTNPTLTLVEDNNCVSAPFSFTSTLTIGQQYILVVDGCSGAPINFTINGTPLPITLEYFNAEKLENGTNLLTWKTSQEINNKQFDIEKSNDEINFELMNTVEGSLNSNTEKKYSIIDSKPFVGKNYYRLNQIDIDGKSSFSKVISIINSSNGIYVKSIIPNPIGNLFDINIASNKLDKITYEIVDVLGKKIISDKLYLLNGENQIQINSSDFASGIYFFNMIDSKGNKTTIKINK